MPLAVSFRPPGRTIHTNLGVEKQTITLVAEKEMCVDTVHEVLRQVSAEQIITQHREGNQNPRVIVDGVVGKPVRLAERKVVILFPAAAMQVALGIVRAALRLAIRSTTTRRTGSLDDDWQFIHIIRDENGQVIRSQVVSATADLAIGPRDSVVLRPSGPDAVYAAFVNRLVARGSAAKTTVAKVRRTVAKRAGPGFMARAARQMRRHPVSQAFKVTVVFSKRYAPPGASRKQGLPVIVFSPRLK